MASDKDYLNYVMKLLSPIEGVSSKSMFGGYGLFHEGSMFALISGNGLFFKIDDSNRSLYEQAGSKQYKPMPYYQVPTEVLEDTGKLLDWANISISVAHSTVSKKKRQR
jgi:DNA transformation protein